MKRERRSEREIERSERGERERRKREEREIPPCEVCGGVEGLWEDRCGVCLVRSASRTRQTLMAEMDKLFVKENAEATKRSAITVCLKTRLVSKESITNENEMFFTYTIKRMNRQMNK